MGATDVATSAVRIPARGIVIDGDLALPRAAGGLVIFAHGSGSSRFSRRNRAVADVLVADNFATLLLDLLTREEEAIDQHTGQFRFDIDLLAERVVAAIDWAGTQPALAAIDSSSVPPSAQCEVSTQTPVFSAGSRSRIHAKS